MFLIIFLDFYFNFTHLSVLPGCVSVYHACLWPEKGTESPGTGVTDGCKLAGHHTRGTLQEQQLPLTAVPSQQPLNSYAFIIFDYKYVCVHVGMYTEI